MQTRISDCPIDGAMTLLSGRWRALIVYYLSQGPMRFNELRRANQGISQQMLTRELRALEAAKVISRTVHPEVPPRVEYRLTAAGRRLMPIIDDLADWWESLQAGAAGAGQSRLSARGEPLRQTG
ncbi:MAG: helix-turn-helix transcriptional regulator [Pseudomonadota bacterium]|nr:helix-turn-helix transcriptional regulator [Pseudomonadota bacterium]